MLCFLWVIILNLIKRAMFKSHTWYICVFCWLTKGSQFVSCYSGAWLSPWPLWIFAWNSDPLLKELGYPPSACGVWFWGNVLLRPRYKNTHSQCLRHVLLTLYRMNTMFLQYSIFHKSMSTCRHHYIVIGQWSISPVSFFV